MTTPNRIAVLGAGPIGIDAALAAHDAGVSFTLYEFGDDVGANVGSWGHVRLFTPWSMNLSDRMRSRLAPGQFLSDSECPTGAEFLDLVLRPLAQHRDLRQSLRRDSRVVAVSRAGLVKSDEIGTGARATRPFRLLVRSSDGEETVDYADLVLDCTGTYGNPNPLGDGGIPAPGESAAGDRISREIPDVEGQSDRWAAKTIMLVGGGHSGQTAATRLADLAARAPGTSVIWCRRDDTRRIAPIPDDPLPGRVRLTAEANELLSGGSPHVEIRSGWVVDEIEPGASPAGGRGLNVVLRERGGDRDRVAVDLVISLTGYVGDNALYRQLQVHECYATSGPMKLAAALLAEGGGDCLQQASHGLDTLKSPEPNFYMLGSKSYGRNNTFLLRVGYDQVDEVFGALAGPPESHSNPKKESPAA